MSEKVRQDMQQLLRTITDASYREYAETQNIKRKSEDLLRETLRNLSDDELAELYRHCVPWDAREKLRYPGEEARWEIVRRFCAKNLERR